MLLTILVQNVMIPVPPTPPPALTGDGVRQAREYDEERLRELVEHDRNDWIDILYFFTKVNNN